MFKLQNLCGIVHLCRQLFDGRTQLGLAHPLFALAHLFGVLTGRNFQNLPHILFDGLWNDPMLLVILDVYKRQQQDLAVGIAQTHFQLACVHRIDTGSQPVQILSLIHI